MRRLPTLHGMDRTEPPARTMGLVPRIVVAGVVLFAALTVIGWVVGTVLAVLRSLLVVAVIVAAAWAVLASRRD